MSSSTARYEVLRRRLERFTRMLHGVETGDVNAIHRTRVASRRLREVLPVLQLEPDEANRLGRRLRKVTERLGTIRELDVLLLVLAEVSESGEQDQGAVARVAASVRDERDRARGRLLGKSPVTELHRLAARLAKTAAALEAADARPRRGAEPRSWRWAVDARVARRASSVLEAVSAAGAVYLPERLHAVRIATKKLRYALEVAADASAQRRAADLRLLRRVQDHLGRLHDRQVLVERARAVQASLTPPDLTTWRHLDRLIASLEDECRRLHGRYMRGRDALEGLCTRLAGNAAGAARAAEVKSERARTKRTAR